MLYTKFQAPKPSGSEVEDFFIFSMYFYGSNPGTPEAGLLWTWEPPLEQTCYRITSQCYLPNSMRLSLADLEKKNLKYIFFKPKTPTAVKLWTRGTSCSTLVDSCRRILSIFYFQTQTPLPRNCFGLWGYHLNKRGR